MLLNETFSDIALDTKELYDNDVRRRITKSMTFANKRNRGVKCVYNNGIKRNRRVHKICVTYDILDSYSGPFEENIIKINHVI